MLLGLINLRCSKKSACLSETSSDYFERISQIYQPLVQLDSEAANNLDVSTLKPPFFGFKDAKASLFTFRPDQVC